MESHASNFGKTVARRIAQADIRPRSSRAALALAWSLAVWLLSVTFAAADLPSWITARPQARLVILAMDAGVGDANQGLNFNGHHDGSHRVMVPLGWTVVVRMRNSDARVPHSALITRVYRQEEMPERLGAQDTAFPGAATPVPFNGTAAGGYAEFTFVANQTGHYLVACGVQTHLQAGMWLRLDVVEGLSGPDLRHDH
jgi:Sulfocyanin (SoxE) domain